MRHLFRSFSIVAAIAIAACGGSGGYDQTTAPPPPQNTIAATPALAFGPDTLTVNAGQTVTFAFGSVAHNVFFDQQAGAPADIDGLNANVSVQRVFATAGVYHYSCHIHPSMHGTVVVN
jgi:plastocyanin